ncbi:hypothetical protein ADUPG1_001828, partial [Aduncisulcus paluster]
EEISDGKELEEKDVVLSAEEDKTMEKPDPKEKTLLIEKGKGTITSGIEINPSTSNGSEIKVSTPMKTMTPSEIQTTTALKLTVIEPGRAATSLNGICIERLLEMDTEIAKTFLKKIFELKNTHGDLIIPPFGQLMTPVIATQIGYVLGQTLDLTCTNQKYLMDTIEKGIKAFPPDDVFRKFLTEGRKIKCECSPDQESITMNQALRYTTAWGVLRVNLLEGQKINRGKEASIVDALVDGIRPLHFRRAIRDAVEKLRT